MSKPKTKRGWFVALGIMVVLIAAVLLSPPGRAFLDIWRTGAIQDAVVGVEKNDYSGTSRQNLKALYTAMMLYHDSEGQYPHAAGWMDAIENRLEVNTLKDEAAQKKLVRPDLLSKKDSYGYAMNDAADAKYKDDVKDPKTPLIYESKQSTRNAHGDPATDHEGPNYVSVDGTVLQFGK